MNKKLSRAIAFALLMLAVMAGLCGCGKESASTDEQLLAAIKKYCCTMNPDLENIANAGEYPVYWEIVSSDEQEAVVLFRSYTGAQVRSYIDRATGETYMTEFVPGITTEEQRTGESFNVKDYFPKD